MKTIKQINEDIIKELDSLKVPGLSKHQIRKIKGDLVKLKSCKMYLETSPNPEFIKRSYESLNMQINAINNRYSEYLGSGVPNTKKTRATWNKMNNMSLLKYQKATLKYILS